LDTVADTAERELTRMVERRSRDEEVDPDELEPGYIESTRRFNEARRRENSAAWYAYERRMAELHARLSEEHAAKAEALCEEDLGEGVS
jgi:hypothetical protein